MIRWRIEMLGGLRARAGDRQLSEFQTRKTAALVACLAARLPRPVAREELVDLLWPEAEPAAGRNRLTQAIVWLRPHLEIAGVPRGSVLRADRQFVGFSPQAVTTDVAEFEAALREAGPAVETETPLQVAALQRAVALYQGELLPNFYEDWVLVERQRLLSLFLTAVHRLVHHYERANAWEHARDYARRGLAADPLAEDLHVTVMRVLAASGQAAAALRHYHELERLLRKELDATPAAATTALAARIQREGPVSRATVFSAPPAGPAPEAQPSLPTSLTRFFGRDSELSQVETLLLSGGVRLVTLCGVGGAGKTRLALEAAARLALAYGGAVWFVPLAELAEARRLPQALAAALHLPRTDAPWDQIVDALRRRRTLLILDNLEHLVAEGAPLLRDLLDRVPTLQVLVTSRQRLGLEGEREISVAPLPLPPSGARDPEALLRADSVGLFVDRAQAVRPAFRITPENAADVARLCMRLEGLPLALELCAAWAQTLTPAQMLAHLARRFDLLVSRRTDIAARHRTLRAAVEYSYLMLPPSLQQLFVSLSVFRGGWTGEAAQAVCFEAKDGAGLLETLGAMTELRERSLIVADEDHGRMRYRMLETLREFAAEQRTLAMEAPLRRRHAAFFVGLAEAGEPHMAGPKQGDWLGRLDTEHDNSRAALAWCVEARQETGLRLAGALATFWGVRGYAGEGQEWLETLLALPLTGEGACVRLSVRAKALNALGHLARARADFPTSEAAVQQALRLRRALGDEAGVAVSLQILATLAYSREDYDGARTFLEDALRVGRKLADSSMVAGALLNLGNVAMELGELPEAWALYSESLSLHRAAGNPGKIASALNNLGLVARYRGDLVAAQGLFREDLALCRQLADRSGTAIALLNLGTVHRLAGRHTEARSALEEAAGLAAEADNRRALAWCVKELGHLACAEGDYAAGTHLLAVSEYLRRVLGMSYKPADPDALAQDTARARAVLGEAAYAEAWAGAGTPSFDAIIALVCPSLPRPTPDDALLDDAGEAAEAEKRAK